jgi:hypothetical protein
MRTGILTMSIALGVLAAGAALQQRSAIAANGVTVNAHTIHREVIPSFSRQTGLACNQCHTTFPQLTAFGRRFKLNGYTLTRLQMVEAGDTANRSLKINLIPPVSAMVQASISQTSKAQPGAQNGNVSLPQQMSVFLGEEITPRVGTFLQFTYAAVDGSFGIDNADIRYANQGKLGSKEIIYGFSLNNNPTVQDLWNTTPAWGFPWAGSDMAPTPAAATLIDGALGQQVAGLGAYAMWDNHVYGEFSVYRSAQQGGLHPPGVSGTDTSHNVLKGVAPYWRGALQHTWGSQYLEVGTYGMSTRLYPTGVTGAADRYTDVALDAQYERKVGKGSITAHTTWIHEAEKLPASVTAGLATNASNTLKTFKIDGSYYTAGRVGLTVSYFSTSGDADALRYSGSAIGSPNSNGVVGELDFLPWLNTRFTLQYVAYSKFDGASKAYDGARNASDNNTLYLLTWLVF